jgi:hypothetical protein
VILFIFSHCKRRVKKEKSSAPEKVMRRSGNIPEPMEY